MDSQPRQIGGEHVGIGQRLDHIAREHRHQGGADLDEELQLGAQGVDIIKNAQHNDNGSSQQHPAHGRGKIQKDQHAEQEAQINGKSAHPGNGVIVHPAVVLRHVHRAHFKGQALDHRCGHQSHQEGHHQGGRHHPHQG